MIKILLKDGVISFEEFLIGNLMLKYKDPNISLATLFNIIEHDDFIIVN